MKYAGLVIVLVILALLVMEFNSRTAELNRLRSEQEVINARLLSKKQTLAALDAQIAYATSDAAVMKWAYENHMARPQDYVVAPVGAIQATPTPQPTPQPTPTSINQLMQWLSLFYDAPTPAPER